LLKGANFGFRAGKSCNDALTIMKLVIDAANHNKSNLFIGSLDIHKAFDKVPWQGVVNGMRRIGITENIIKLLTTIQFNGEVALHRFDMVGIVGWKSPRLCWRRL
jgi:hypothetical protein